MHAADVSPVPRNRQTQSPFDLFVIFAGANIVATTLQVGASLGAGMRPAVAAAVIIGGVACGSLLVAALAPVGPRLGVPSIIAARAALGLRGGAVAAGVLYVTNFAWIAVNTVIAASVAARLFGAGLPLEAWVVALGVCATAVVAGGPSAVRIADRIAVPLLVAVGAVLTWNLWHADHPPLPATGTPPLSWLHGLDVVMGYQVSWVLMFADFSRYTRSERGAFGAVLLGLAITSLWLMPLGFAAARVAGSADPGSMLQAAGLGAWGAGLMVLATLTTNFVNIYLSALAWRSVFPGAGERGTVWAIGAIGTGLALAGGQWLDRYVAFMLVLGGLLVPVGGILVAHYVVARVRVHVPALYDPTGPYARWRGFSLPGLAAWAAGTAAYAAGATLGGGTLPALAVAMATYLLARKAAGG